MRPDIAQPDPVARIARSVIQVVLAVAVAVPTAAALFDFSAATSARFSAFAGAVVILVTAAQNGLEAKAGQPIVGAPGKR